MLGVAFLAFFHTTPKWFRLAVNRVEWLIFRMVRDRQHAERCRKAGIEAYSNKQWAKAYMHFDEGCHAERSNPKLHSNAAMAAIKMGCYAQSIEHCEKVIRLHEFLLEKPEHPLVVKAWQRMAAARVGLKHFKEAAEVS